MKRNWKTTVVNLATKDGVIEITKSLSTLNSTTIWKYFSQFYKEIKKNLSFLKSEIVW